MRVLSWFQNHASHLPGAIGAAHQAGFSNGYSATCPGTPAKGSPYIWPMAWSADTDTQSMPFGSDEIMWHSKGRTFYRLDKNWKRSDTTYSNGVLRTIGQDPCADINADESANGVVGCNQNSDFAAGKDPLTTMIHKGSKMYFITWKNSTEVKVGETNPLLIEECNHMDLMVIGNIRPDWFLDDRGDDTDVQYLGDQHVYYASGDNDNDSDSNDNNNSIGGVVPRLVKQWRKKDFASEYFTMSVTGNPRRKKKLVVENATDASGTDNEDGNAIHWPLILNIPGEGFGDDMLQVYQNHELLSDDDDDLFLLVENLIEASGARSCPLITGFGDEGNGNEQSFGPPTLEVSVPSNLEVDPNSWFSNVYTFSPVWEAPASYAAGSMADESSSSSTNVAVTEEGRVRVESCYDPSSQSVELTVEWLDVDPITGGSAQLPWVSLGYRTSELCAMNPPDGGESKIIVVSQGPNEDAAKAYAGSLHPGSKGLDKTAIFSVYESFWPLDKTMGYSDVSLSVPTDGVSSASAAVNADAAKIERAAPVQAKNPTATNSVKLSFKQKLQDNGGAKPDVMHLMYAIGMSSQLGIHTSRGCFDVVEFPTCSVSGSATSTTSSGGIDIVSAMALEETIESEDGAPSSSTSLPTTTTTTLLAGIAAISSVLSLA